MKRILLVLALLGLVACQSKAEALKVLCDAPSHPDVRAASPDMRMTILAKHVESNISNGEMKDLFKAFATMSLESRHKAFKTALDAEGISSCKMLDVWKPEDKK